MAPESEWLYLQIIVVLHYGLAKDLELLDLLLQLSPRAGGVFEVELRVSELAHQGGTLGTQTCLDGLCVHNEVLRWGLLGGIVKECGLESEGHLDQSILSVPEGREPLKPMDKLGDVAAHFHGGRWL